jgi:hypothetical protein
MLRHSVWRADSMLERARRRGVHSLTVAPGTVWLSQFDSYSNAHRRRGETAPAGRPAEPRHAFGDLWNHRLASSEGKEPSLKTS